MVKKATTQKSLSKGRENKLSEFKRGKAYRIYLTELKQRIRSAQLKAARVVNLELISLYWEMGKSIIVQQKSSKWGSGFVEALSKDLYNEFPGMSGFSATNLKRMRRFAEHYPVISIRPQAVAQLPWGHICTLIERVKDTQERDWYAAQALEHGWSRSVMEIHIDSDLFARQAKLKKKTSNFLEKLPPEQSDLALQSLKDPYIFDFLTIGPDANEQEIEHQLTTHIAKFLLELGTGFAFMGRQVPLAVGESDFKLDMLFYHVKLRCYIVIELKARKFRPTDAGQLNFYLAAVDEQIKSPQDNPTIGILLCQSKDKIVAEYALKNVSSPMGVSDYKLTKMMPKDLKKSLPSIEQIEAELKADINKK